MSSTRWMRFKRRWIERLTGDRVRVCARGHLYRARGPVNHVSPSGRVFFEAGLCLTCYPPRGPA